MVALFRAHLGLRLRRSFFSSERTYLLPGRDWVEMDADIDHVKWVRGKRTDVGVSIDKLGPRRRRYNS